MKIKPPDLPLAGITVIELSGIGPVPYAGRLFADMGAQVTRIEKRGGINLPLENKGKQTLSLDLQSTQDKTIVFNLIKNADIILEGSRPGVMERLGLGPQKCHAVNPKLIYGRMTGWGQTGPWAHKAGHDINYIGLTGALHAMGEPSAPPVPPLNLLGDYGGGSMFLVMKILAALLQTQTTGKGQVIDAAIIDGTASMMGIVHALADVNMWTPQRGSNLLDGSRPYYRCYTTQDKKFMAVGCLEEKFYKEMLDTLGLNEAEFGSQNTPALWPEQIKTLQAVFAAKPRQHWEAIFDTSDACITPVLDYEEAAKHAHNIARANNNSPLLP